MSTPTSTAQQERLDYLRAQWAKAADAVREFDAIADLVENRGRTFSDPAHKDAVELLRERSKAAQRAADRIKGQLRDQEGYHSCR